MHNSLVTAIRDTLVPQLAPRYYVGMESRMVIVKPEEFGFVGRADVGVMLLRPLQRLSPLSLADIDVLEVELPIEETVHEAYLEVHEVISGKLVTTIEVLSPYNKINTQGKREYLAKRYNVMLSLTNLVEIDLLRAGEPMPINRRVQCDYRILVARGSYRMRARLYPFSVRQAIPAFALPLLPGDNEPLVDLNTIVHDLYTRARFDLRLNYTKPAVPPLSDADAAWARELIDPMKE